MVCILPIKDVTGLWRFAACFKIINHWRTTRYLKTKTLHANKMESGNEWTMNGKTWMTETAFFQLHAEKGLLTQNKLFSHITKLDGLVRNTLTLPLLDNYNTLYTFLSLSLYNTSICTIQLPHLRIWTIKLTQYFSLRGGMCTNCYV